MLLITIENDRQRSQYRHEVGPLILGRYPHSQQTHVVIDDDYVSRRQLLLEERPLRRVQLENVGRNDVQLDGGERISTGQSREADLPISLRVGRTLVKIALEEIPAAAVDTKPEGIDRPVYQTVSLPFQRQHRPTVQPLLAGLGEGPSAEELAEWFETLLSVQRSAVGSTAFYQETAQALVDLVGLDRGLVLLRDATGWQVAGGHAKNESIGLEYSKSVVNEVVSQERTLFGSPESMSIKASLVDLEAVVASPIFGERGKVVGLLYGSRDFLASGARAGIQPLEAQIVQLLASSVSSGLVRLQMQERLNQAEQMAAVGQAIGYIIHDLRGPLGNVQQLLEMSEDDRHASISREERRELIDESLAISLDLLNDSLEFCRGNVQVEPLSGTFRELMDRHLRLLRIDIETFGVQLEIVVPDDLRVSLDPDRMARVIRNLAKNAAEALQGQERPVVTIGARETGIGIELSVADNGPGLPEEVCCKLFRPFATHRKRSGTGFGLAIARQLVEAHNGQITVESGPQGTRFTITLPAEDDDENMTQVNAPISADRVQEVRNSEDVAPSGPRRVLLAEDGQVNQRLVCVQLRNAGHSVTVAGNGREAVLAWETDPFDLVLMDVEMPEMDGLEATRAIRTRERPSEHRTPIVGLTAHQSAETERICREAGMDAVLVKPLRPAELLHLVETLT